MKVLNNSKKNVATKKYNFEHSYDKLNDPLTKFRMAHKKIEVKGGLFVNLGKRKKFSIKFLKLFTFFTYGQFLPRNESTLILSSKPQGFETFMMGKVEDLKSLNLR